MASEGPNGTTYGNSSLIVGDDIVDWTNPGNITAENGSYATCNLGAGQISWYLASGAHGFSIPDGATIDGVVVEWLIKKGSGLESMIEHEAKIYVDDVLGSENKATSTQWPFSAAAYRSFGGAADTWSESLTPALVNDDNSFGAVLSAKPSGAPGTASVDHCRITIYYTGSETGKSMVQSRSSRARRSAIPRM